MFRNYRLHAALLLGLVLVLSPAPARAQASSQARPQPTPESGAVYLVYYWRARPGKAAEYSDYIRTVAEPVDEEAHKAGVFDEVHTYVPALVTGAPGSDWTHMRVFKLKSLASWDAFQAGLDDAGKRVVPDEQQRKANSARAAELRDLVRQEVWRELR